MGAPERGSGEGKEERGLLEGSRRGGTGPGAPGEGGEAPRAPERRGERPEGGKERRESDNAGFPGDLRGEGDYRGREDSYFFSFRTHTVLIPY